MSFRQLLRSLRVRILAGQPASQRRAGAPRVERLEGREVPTAFANQAFVAALYQGLLGRAPEPGPSSYWVGQLNAGATPGQVASGILTSGEYRGREVTNLYQALLGRSPDLNGLNVFAGQLVGGATLDQVKAGILGSDEFFRRAGATPSGFLNALYQDVLGRPPDSVGQAVFGPAATGAAGRASAALAVLGSAESAQVKLSNAYREFLGRPPDPLGQGVWLGALQAGRDEAVWAGLFGSAELFGRLEAAIGGTDAGQAASQFIAANHLFQVAPTGPSSPAAPPADVPAQSAALVQSAVFGPLTLPAGFDPSSLVAAAGAFGPSGFLADRALPALSAQSEAIFSTSANGTNGINGINLPALIAQGEAILGAIANGTNGINTGVNVSGTSGNNRGSTAPITLGLTAGNPAANAGTASNNPGFSSSTATGVPGFPSGTPVLTGVPGFPTGTPVLAGVPGFPTGNPGVTGTPGFNPSAANPSGIPGFNPGSTTGSTNAVASFPLR